MSLLNEILKSCDDINLKEINEQLPHLTENVQNLKSGVIEHFEQLYVLSLHKPKEIAHLLNKSAKHQEELTSFKSNIDNVVKKNLIESQKDIDKYKKQLDEIDLSLSFVKPLLSIQSQLEACSDLINGQEYLKCLHVLDSILEEVEQVQAEPHLAIIDALRIKINKKRCYLTMTLLPTMLKKHLEYGSKDNESFIKFSQNSEELAKILEALSYKDLNKLKDVSKFVLNNLFASVINSVVELKEYKENGFSCLQVHVINRNKQSSYYTVFDNIKVILKFLLNNFNYSLFEGSTTLDCMGDDIREEFSNILISNCLSNTVPSKEEELEQYKTVVSDIESFEKELRKCKIYTEETSPILQYANNIDVHFINKKCKEYRVFAESLMKKDLHTTTEVGQPYNPNSLSDNLNKFPQCSISKSVEELIQFAEKILAKSLQASEVCSGRSYCTVLTIFSTYPAITTQHHSKLLQTIPQQIALYYNNCYYIAYNLGEWNDKYIMKLSSVLKSSSENFDSIILKLKTSADEAFEEQVNQQIKQISEIMKDSGLDVKSLEKLDAKTEKCIRQCIRQQELLKTVWSKVLSYTKYNTTIGTILNHLCEIIVGALVKIEDINDDVAEQLVEIFKVMFNRGPKLFTDPKEINLYVEKWYRFNELNFVLGAGLVNINDRWADGKGPLALQFKPEELKQLIRALFQNTDRRAAILAKIQ